MTMAITKEDFDKVVEGISILRIDVAVIKKELENRPQRPCLDHVALRTEFDAHKRTQAMWTSPLVDTAIDVIKMALVALVVWSITSYRYVKAEEERTRPPSALIQ